MSSFGLYNFKSTGQEKLDLSTEISIFDLEPSAFRREIATRIPVGKYASITLSNLYDIYITTLENISSYSEEDQIEYRRYKDRTTKRIRETVNYLVNKYENKLISSGKKIYWVSVEKKNISLNQETTQGMSLSRAMTYSLVKDNLINLLPPVEIESLAPYFEAAKKSLHKFEIAQRNKLNATEYSPFSVGFIPKPLDSQVHQTIFDAIEYNKVIKATYESIHGGIPEKIIFSPQKIVMQFQQTQVIGFVHNADATEGKSDNTNTYVNSDGIYRHLTLNNFTDVEVVRGYSYKQEEQPYKNMKFVAYAHEWVTKNLSNLKISSDQEIIHWDEMTDADKNTCKKLREKQPEKWSKVTATISLPKSFLDFRGEWDSWFFTNAISMYGADLLVESPAEVVDEIKRRITGQNFAYFK